MPTQRRRAKRVRSGAAERAVLTESSRQEIERVLADAGWESFEQMTVDDWENADLDALRDILGAEQFEALLDEIADRSSHEL